MDNPANLPELPENVVVFRTNGNVLCPVCGIPYWEHQMYLYPGLDYGPVKGCDGGYYHL